MVRSNNIVATQTAHTLSTFNVAMKEIRNSVLTMASITQQNMEFAIRGLLERSQEACNEAIADDDEVNSFEKVVDTEGMQILIRFSPVAADLRHVLAAMKIAGNLERISDQAQSVARRARKIIKHPEVSETRSVEPLFEMAINLYKDSIRCYAEGDVELALSLYERDQELDKAHSKMIKELTKTMERQPSNLKTYLHLIFILRCLERIGDHAVNIGEDAVFAESAADIRHVGARALTDS